MLTRDSDIVWTGAPVTAAINETAALLHDARAIVRRFVVLTSEQAIVIALWILHTHTIDAADTTPYLHITSATKRAGKTRLLEVLEAIVRRPWLTGRTSAAALVRKIDVDAPSLLLDESDTAFGGDKDYAEALRGILNSGYKRSGKASLCVGKGADLSVRDFSTYSAKAIAGIGKLPDTIADRAIAIALKRRMVSEPVERWRERDGLAMTLPVRQRLVRWSGTDTLTALRVARPTLPAQLSDRAQDVWEPLLAIADMAGADWPALARRAAVALMGSVEDTDPAVEMLTDIASEVLIDETRSVIPTAEIIAKLVALDHRAWATWKHDKPISPRGLARLLGPVGVHPTRLEHVRGYRRDAFDDAVARYLPVLPSLCQHPNESGPKTQDGCSFNDPEKTASVRQFEAGSIEAMTDSHIDQGDDSDERF